MSVICSGPVQWSCKSSRAFRTQEGRFFSGHNFDLEIFDSNSQHSPSITPEPSLAGPTQCLTRQRAVATASPATNAVAAGGKAVPSAAIRRALVRNRNRQKQAIGKCKAVAMDGSGRIEDESRGFANRQGAIGSGEIRTRNHENERRVVMRVCRGISSARSVGAQKRD